MECLGQHDLLGNPNRLSAAMQGIWNREAATRMKEILHELPLEDTVVHVHMWGKALSSSVVRAASDLGFPIVLTLHDFLSVCPTGTLFITARNPSVLLTHVARCIASNCDARSYRQNFGGRSPANPTWPGQTPFRYRRLYCHLFHVQSVMEQYLPTLSRVHLVENPVEVERAPKVDVGINSKFVFLGRLAAEKGPCCLLKLRRRQMSMRCLSATVKCGVRSGSQCRRCYHRVEVR